MWLFNTFLHAMGGVAPKNIITDQDFAMRNAIDEVFIRIVHRNCRWHIMKKAHEKLGRLMADDEPLNKAFKDCVDNSLNGIVFSHNTLYSYCHKLHNCAAISNVTMLNYSKL